MRRGILTYFISMALTMTMIPTQNFAQELTETVQFNNAVTTSSTTSSQLKTNAYVGEGYEVGFKVVNQWVGAFTGEFVLTNTSDEILENWTLAFDFAHEITNIWDAQIVTHEGEHYILKNMVWNQDILPGESISIGFEASFDEEIVSPEIYELLSVKEETSGCTIDFKVTNDWEEAFNGEISITNNTEKTIEDWILSFDFDKNIENFWTAEIIAHEGNHYIIKNRGYNANIVPGQTITLGFVGNLGNVVDAPTNYVLEQMGQALDAEDEIDYEKDTDSDDLPDCYENILGTDSNNVDSDEDGLPDGYEVFILGTNPTLQDTDDNGIYDGEEDFDEDGLKNIDEYELGTNPKDNDTDGDGLLDGEEVYNFETDPLLIDTDGDGLSDGDEIKLGFNPLLKDTDGNGIWDSEEKVEQVFVKEIVNSEKPEVKNVSVSLSCAGVIDNVVSIRDTYDEDVLSSGVVGLIGAPVQIESKKAFEEATIAFEYDESMLAGTREEDLAIMWYDEANDVYQIFDEDSVIDTQNNTVTYTTTHFSTYLLVDRQKWYDAWKEKKDYTRTQNSQFYYDIAFVVDISGSMKGAKITNTKEGLSRFINAMYEGDDCCIIKFNTAATVQKGFGSTTGELLEGVDALSAIGGTNTNVGLLKGIQQIINKDTNNEPIIIMICDGDVKYVQSTIDLAIQNNIKIYTVNIANAVAHEALEKISEQTGGSYYDALTAEELTDILMSIQCQTVTGIDLTDTDGDGLPDVMETEGMRIQNGEVITTDPLVADTDGDNLLDSEEISFTGKLRTLNFSQNVSATATYLSSTSNPNLVDSDYDGKYDNEDTKPNSNTFSGTLHTDFADAKVSYTMDYREFFKANTSYSKKIGTISSLYSSVVYDNNTYASMDIDQFMSDNGLKEIVQYDIAKQYSDADVSEAYIGHREVTYNGEDREIIAIVVRGTNGTIEEWSSNFDIGTTKKKSSYSDWSVSSNHKGFDVAATRILKCLTAYEKSHDIDESAKSVYWVMGHSRGAGIANIIGARLVNESKYVYTYTFAAPNTTTAQNASSYVGIYNILNKDDFVPYLPMADWGFTHYGKSAVISIADNYEKEWENLTGCKNRFGVVDYNIDAIGMDDTIEKLSNLVNNRNECYIYTCKCHGDGSLDKITITNRGTSKKSREAAIKKIPSVALPYCKITRYDGGLISGWDFKVCQQPEYFMQVLAAYMAGDINEVRFAVELNIADRYESAKSAIISSGLGGLEHPHYTESYYLLSTHVTNNSF